MTEGEGYMKKKKLAIFVNSLARGGAEKVVFLLAKELQEEFEIHLLVFSTDGIAFDLPAGIPVVQIGKAGNTGKAADLLKILRCARTVKKYLQDNEIRVMLSFLSRPNFTAGLVKMLGWKGSAIISERTMTSVYYSSKTMSGKIGRFLVKHLYKRANLIITNSKLNEQDLKTTFGLKNSITTIYNPIDIAEVEQAERAITAAEKDKRNDDFVFCNIGRYDYYKNQSLLLKAFAQVTGKMKLVIVGKDVPEKLSPLCAELQLGDRVQLIDLQRNIFPYLLQADAFVLSSVMEGFPNVLLEALSCSLPVISTDCWSGPREILAPGTDYPAAFNRVEEAEFGLLVNNNDAAMLAAAMQQMAADPALCKRYAGKAFERAKCFDITVIVKAFRETINSFYTGAASTV
jgi:N-acetylgalactosamine-N,N'-diacetylbacillosaminyl-diphospho-undecaprenol 4-alpha-N-acetylgalactosaminyltransferase